MILARPSARPWPERPVSAANKSGSDYAGPRVGITCPAIV